MFIAHIYEQRATTLLAREHVVETLREREREREMSIRNLLYVNVQNWILFTNLNYFKLWDAR